MDGFKLKTKILLQAVVDISAAYEYMRAFNPALQDRVDTKYLGAKIEPAIASLMALDKILADLVLAVDLQREQNESQ